MCALPFLYPIRLFDHIHRVVINFSSYIIFTDKTKDRCCAIKKKVIWKAYIRREKRKESRRERKKGRERERERQDPRALYLRLIYRLRWPDRWITIIPGAGVVKYRDHACFKRILVHAYVRMYTHMYATQLSSTHVAPVRARAVLRATCAARTRFQVPECVAMHHEPAWKL